MHDIFVPALGMASESALLVEWLKQPGDDVAEGDALATIETDKSSIDVEATASGVLGAHLFPAESEVPMGGVITTILEPGDEGPATSESEEKEEDSSTDDREDVDPRTAEEPDVVVAQPTEDRSHFADAHPSGEILNRADRRRDPATGELEPYALSPRARAARAAAPAPTVAPAPAVTPAPAETTSPDSTDRYRAAIGAAVSRSWAEIPHFAVQRELRVEPLLQARSAMAALSSSVTFTDVLLKAYALSLMDHVGTREVHIGLAVATDRGVAIPVLRDVARSDVLQIADLRAAAVTRAQTGRQGVDDAIAPHSTLSNLGALGVDSFTAIVPHGQTSILSVGAAKPRPVVEDGTLTVGTTMVATLNVDHRTWDGLHVAEVLARLAAIIAQPALLTSLSS